MGTSGLRVGWSRRLTAGSSSTSHSRVSDTGHRFGVLHRKPMCAARYRLNDIKRQIEVGALSFAEELPDYRLLRRLGGTVKVRSCKEVVDEFLAHCEARLARSLPGMIHCASSLAASAHRGNAVINPRVRQPIPGQLLAISYADFLSIRSRSQFESTSVTFRAARCPLLPMTCPLPTDLPFSDALRRRASEPL
jgi:hypothetical protein